MAGLKFKLTGLDNAIKQLNKLGGDANREIAKSLFQEMEVEVAGRAKESLAAVSPGGGDLRESIHVIKPKITRGGVSVTVVAGGPAAPYAKRVHEWLDSRVKWSVPGTGPKYLERPFLEALPGMERAVRNALATAIRKARR